MKKIINILLISVFLFSCDGNNLSVTKNTAVTTMQSSERTKKQVTDFDPEYAQGIKYVYSSRVTKDKGKNVTDSVKEESTTEVIKIDPTTKKVTLKISNTTIQNTNTPQVQATSSVKEDLVENFSDGLPEKVTFIKNEDITVLGGTFKDTTVVSYKFITPTNIEIKSTLWLHKGIGAIKKIDILPDSTEITTELKTYKMPISKSDFIKFLDTTKIGTKYKQNNLDDKNVLLENTNINREILEIKDNKIKIKSILKDNKEETNDYSYDDFYSLKNSESFFIENIDKITINNKEYNNLFLFLSDKLEITFSKQIGLVKRKETLVDNKKLLMEINE